MGLDGRNLVWQYHVLVLAALHSRHLSPAQRNCLISCALALLLAVGLPWIALASEKEATPGGNPPEQPFAMDSGVSSIPLLDSLPLLDDWLEPAPALPWAIPLLRTASPTQPARYRRILLVGECNIEGGLGPLLQKQLEQEPGVEVKRIGKRSTGLARLDYFDWPARIRQLKDEFQPDLIVAYWGDNDCQNCILPSGKRAAAWGDAEAWHSEYARRTAEVVALMREGGCAAVIVGMPNMRPEKFRKGISRVNAALAEGCLLSGGVFIDSWQFNTGAGGEYLSLVEWNGTTRTFQGEDGIHFTSHGAKFMAGRIHGELATRFSFGDAVAVVADAERVVTDGEAGAAGETS